MSAPPPGKVRGGSSAITPARIVIGLCLVIPFVALLSVSTYARVKPTFIGIPFFYWYQMLWVVISAALTIVAFLLVRREQAQKRAQREDGAR